MDDGFRTPRLHQGLFDSFVGGCARDLATVCAYGRAPCVKTASQRLAVRISLLSIACCARFSAIDYHSAAEKICACPWPNSPRYKRDGLVRHAGASMRDRPPREILWPPCAKFWAEIVPRPSAGGSPAAEPALMDGLRPTLPCGGHRLVTTEKTAGCIASARVFQNGR